MLPPRRSHWHAMRLLAEAGVPWHHCRMIRTRCPWSSSPEPGKFYTGRGRRRMGALDQTRFVEAARNARPDGGVEPPRTWRAGDPSRPRSGVRPIDACHLCTYAWAPQPLVTNDRHPRNARERRPEQGQGHPAHALRLPRFRSRREGTAASRRRLGLPPQAIARATGPRALSKHR